MFNIKKLYFRIQVNPKPNIWIYLKNNTHKDIHHLVSIFIQWYPAYFSDQLNRSHVQSLNFSHA